MKTNFISEDKLKGCIDNMSKALYLEDPYLKEWKATVKSVTGKDDKKGKFIVLDETAFYPNSGGQPHDEGIIYKNGQEFKVVFSIKIDGGISHEVDAAGLKEGDEVACKLDWNRRYTLMKYHTAAHILSQIIYNETGARITGNQLNTDKGRIDFNLKDFDKNQVENYISKTNSKIREGLTVESFFMDKDKALNDPDLFSLKYMMPKEAKTLRIVKIGDFDKKACGGTHVSNTKEIGKIRLLKIKNKGKNNRRIYFKVKNKNGENE